MELREYVKILQKERKLLAGTVLLLLLSVALFSALRPESYDADLLLLVAKSGTQETNDYKYSGYYALEASEAVSDNISQWLKSASAVNEIYSRAGISGPGELKALSKFFKADKISSQYVRVNYKTGSEESAKKIAKAAGSVVAEKLDSLDKTSGGEISFKIISGEPLVIKSENNVFLNGFLAIVGGLFLGIMFAFAKNYFYDYRN